MMRKWGIDDEMLVSLKDRVSNACHPRQSVEYSHHSFGSKRDLACWNVLLPRADLQNRRKKNPRHHRTSTITTSLDGWKSSNLTILRTGEVTIRAGARDGKWNNSEVSTSSCVCEDTAGLCRGRTPFLFVTSVTNDTHVDPASREFGTSVTPSLPRVRLSKVWKAPLGDFFFVEEPTVKVPETKPRSQSTKSWRKSTFWILKRNNWFR